MRHLFLFFAVGLGLCSPATSPAEDGEEPLGTLADYETPAESDPSILPGVAGSPACDGPSNLGMPSGPRIHDPTDPYTFITLTIQSDPSNPGTLCTASCSFSSTDCWVSSSIECADELTLPYTLPAGGPGTLSQAVVCIQAVQGVSLIPLQESINVVTTNDVTVAVNYTVRGPSLLFLLVFFLYS
jgi:hypothetical protein